MTDQETVRTRHEKVGISIKDDPWPELSPEEQRRGIEALALDSWPILDLSTVELTRTWEEDGTWKIEIAGEMNEHYRDEVQD